MGWFLWLKGGLSFAMYIFLYVRLSYQYYSSYRSRVNVCRASFMFVLWQSHGIIAWNVAAVVFWIILFNDIVLDLRAEICAIAEFPAMLS